jgi:hypothetical protein
VLLKIIELPKHAGMVLAKLPYHFLYGVVLPSPTLQTQTDKHLIALHSGMESAHQPLDGVDVIVQDIGGPGRGIKLVHVFLQAFHRSRQWTAGGTGRSTGRGRRQQRGNDVGGEQYASDGSTCGASYEAGT